MTNGRAITVAGAHRAAPHTSNALLRYQGASPSVRLDVEYIDAMPRRAESAATGLQDRGVRSSARQELIERRLREGFAEGTLLLVQIDRPGSMASVIEETQGAPLTSVTTFITRLPNGQLLGNAITLPRDQEDDKPALARTLRTLEKVTARPEQNPIFGPSAPIAHRLGEGILRDWMEGSFRQRFEESVSRLDPDHAEYVITTNGRDTLPVVLVESPRGWQDPINLARATILETPRPLVRGSRFAILEVGPDGLRYHFTNYRTDGRASVDGSLGTDPESVALTTIERDRLAAETTRALARAARSTISRQTPAVVTD